MNEQATTLGLELDEEPVFKAILVDADPVSATGGADIEKGTVPQGQGSAQLRDLYEVGSPGSDMVTGERVYEAPPIKPELGILAMRRSSRFARAVRTFARNTVGIGWNIWPIKPINDDTPAELREAITLQTETIEAFLNNPHPKIPFTRMMYDVMIDRKATGNGWFEVVRDEDNRPVRLSRLASVSMRVRAEGKDGYVQIDTRGRPVVYFKEFGDLRIMSAKTGLIHVDEDGNTVENRPQLALEDVATEVIHLPGLRLDNDYYGEPEWVPVAPAITGNWMAALRNASFLENDAVPRMAIIANGRALDSESIQNIKDFVNFEGKGPTRAHRVLVLQAAKNRAGARPGQPSQTGSIELKPLTIGVIDDASFARYRAANDEEIREVTGVAKAFFTSADVNRANAQVTRDITNQQEFAPEREEIEYLLNHTIIRAFEEVFGTSLLVQLRFSGPELFDQLEEARINQIYIDKGVITPNEVRTRSLNLPPFPRDFIFADRPLPIVTAMLQMKIGAPPIKLSAEDKAAMTELHELMNRLAPPKTARPGAVAPPPRTSGEPPPASTPADGENA